MTFDVVGTLIDFEGGLKDCLAGIAAEAGVTIDGEEALSLYRAARYCKDPDLFPDDLVRVYLEIAPKLGLPAQPKYGERFRDSTKNWKGFADSAEALARLAKGCRLIAMTNARRWAFDLFAQQLGNPFHAAFTADDTGTEKPDPAFFEKVFDFVRSEGNSKDDILHASSIGAEWAYNPEVPRCLVGWHGSTRVRRTGTRKIDPKLPVAECPVLAHCGCSSGERSHRSCLQSGHSPRALRLLEHRLEPVP